MSRSFPREARITRGAELQRIVREGRRIRTIFIEVRVVASPHVLPIREWRGTRIGLVVPRFKHSAVARNQIKRRLRELARLELLPTGLPVDVVLRIRPEAYQATYENLAADIAQTLFQLRRWQGLLSTESPAHKQGSISPDDT